MTKVYLWKVTYHRENKIFVENEKFTENCRNLVCVLLAWLFDLVAANKTRAVRGSDYSPATVLSEEKDKLVPENSRDRKKNIKGLYQNHMHNFIPC